MGLVCISKLDGIIDDPPPASAFADLNTIRYETCCRLVGNRIYRAAIGGQNEPEPYFAGCRVGAGNR